MQIRSISIFCLALAASLAGAMAQAQSAGTWLARAGAMRISPDVQSGDLTAPSFAGTQADIKAASALSGGVGYMLTDHWALDLPLALPFKHDIVGDGAIGGVGKIGEVKALPITLFAQYRFAQPNAAVRPYLALGLTYAKFFKERGTATLSGLTGGSPERPTTLKIDSKTTATLQVGASVGLQGRWSLNAALAYTPLKTRTTLSTGQTLDTQLDPLSASLEIGYRF